MNLLADTVAISSGTVIFVLLVIVLILVAIYFAKRV